MKAKKVLLTILAIIIVAIALLFIYGSTQPKEVTLERSIVIDRDIETVYGYVSNFKNWKEWSAWNQRDTTMDVSYSGSESGEGAVMSWTSEDSGTGTQTIVVATPPTELKTELDFGDMGTAKSNWTFKEVGGGTEVTWSFWSETGGPLVRGIMALMFDMEKEIGKDYDEGLQNLKNKVESLPQTPNVMISEEDVAGFYYLGVMNTTPVSDMALITDAYGKSYEKIGSYLQSANMQPVGAPMCVVHEYNDSIMVFEPAMVVDKLPASVKGPLKKGEIKACKAVKGIHMGDYAKMESSYEAMQEYISEKGYSISGNPWEVYVNDPGVETDTAKWETHIYFPVTM